MKPLKNKKILVFLIVVLLAANFTPLYPKDASAYEKDVHYWLKFKLAVYCGFTPEEARLIGTGDFGIDANYATEPTKLDLIPTFSAGQHNFHTNIKMEKHALPRHNPVSNPEDGIPEIAAQQDKLFREATSTTDVQNNYSLKLIKFGQFLHYLEDKWSHWGNTYEIGHAIPNLEGESPDNPYNSRAATKDMIFDVMVQMGNLKGPGSICYNADFSKPDSFISPANFPDDFKDKYPNGSPKDASGKSYPDLKNQRDSYFNRIDTSRPTDKITDIYNHLINTAKHATDEGKDLEGVVEDDEAALQAEVAKELNMSVESMLAKYDFIPPWDFSTVLGFAIPFFSTKLDQGIHWDEDEKPKETINPDPNHVFDNPAINPKAKGSTVTPTSPPITLLPVTTHPTTPQDSSIAPGNQVATILVIKHVINDGGGTAQASDFSITVDHSPGIRASPYTFPGSESGTLVTLTGTFQTLTHLTIHEHSSVLDKYDTQKSEQCDYFIGANEKHVCIIYNKFKTTGTGSASSTYLIPGWIKNNARWFDDGKISQQEFTKSVGYLASINVIPTYMEFTKNMQVSVNNDPSIEFDTKSTVHDWVSGSAPDTVFVSLVNELMTNGILQFSQPVAHPPSVVTSPNVNLGSTTNNSVTITVVDLSNGEPQDALVFISGNGKSIKSSTTRDGQIQLMLPNGDYSVQIDSSNYQRLIGTLHVSGDTQQTFQLEKFGSNSSQGTTETTPQTNPTPTQPNTTTGPPTLSLSSKFMVFSHKIGTSPCPTFIGEITLNSDQPGTWSLNHAPSWMTVVLNGDQAKLYFNCQLETYDTQVVTGSPSFFFTGSNKEPLMLGLDVLGNITK